jgi:hypothetical protein
LPTSASALVWRALRLRDDLQAVNGFATVDVSVLQRVSKDRVYTLRA